MEEPPPLVKSANDAAVTESTAPAEHIASPIAYTDGVSPSHSSVGIVQIRSTRLESPPFFCTCASNASTGVTPFLPNNPLH